MKKQLIWAMGLSMALCACKKESKLHNQNPAETGGVKGAKKYAVGFNLSGFTKETKGISSGKLGINATLSDAIKSLSYYAYTGNIDSLRPVKTINQKSTDAGFGTITDSLAAGHYTIFFVGSTSSKYYVTTITDDPVARTYRPALAYVDNNVADTFFQKLEFDVTAAGTQNVVLKRIVGEVTYKLLDALPADVNTIEVTFVSAPPYYDMINGGAASDGHPSNSDDRIQTFTVNSSDKGKTNVEFSTYVWPFPYFATSIAAYNANNVVIGQTKLDDSPGLSVEANTQYVLSGNLFKQSPSNFSITVDSKWNTPQNSNF
ncbi:MAG: hypothetical protein AAGC65_17565 [Mucilaginibacter sp.]|uniref:hypothetical protein n=1 Tax=Mucilaginibacter sp. TaxID=1882438 RepID=UPI0031AE162A